jgi:hypothetical protein
MLQILEHRMATAIWWSPPVVSCMVAHRAGAEQAHWCCGVHDIFIGLMSGPGVATLQWQVNLSSVEECKDMQLACLPILQLELYVSMIKFRSK